MSTRSCLVVAAGLLAVLGVGYSASAGDETVTHGQLRVGMTPAQVRAFLGPPRRVARQVLYHRYLEQWVYDAPHVLRVEFDCQRGQQARLVAANP
jgi:hypothetical protein